MKSKKSLLGNLCGTAVAQMVTLILCSIAMLAFTGLIAVNMGFLVRNFRNKCSRSGRKYGDLEVDCKNGVKKYLAKKVGA